MKKQKTGNRNKKLVLRMPTLKLNISIFEIYLFKQEK